MAFFSKIGTTVTLSTKRVVIYDIISINCEVTSRLLSINTCYSPRPVSLRADAFHGHGLCLLGSKNYFLEKGKHLFCVRCSSRKLSLSSGKA